MARIRKVEIRHVRMTLRKKIKHASQERTASDNLIVVVHLNDGHVGYGEGVPREYVTGETIESAFESLREWNLSEIAGEPECFDNIVRTMDLWTPEPASDDLRGIRSNSARCAAEISVLDAFARHFQVSIGEAVQLSPASTEIDHGDPMTVRYSGAITAETPWKERVSATKMRIWGFRQVKVKVGIPGQDDVSRLRRIRRRLSRACEIRLDANEAWTPTQFKTWSERLAFANPAAYEQPVPHESIACLGDEDFRSTCPVILDESLCGMKDADAAIQGGFGEIFNIRISKCGGFMPSLRLAARANQAGRRYGLGCHPGESPILSAAGRAFASRVRNLAFLEGSYDRHVLADPFGMPDITFGYGGKAHPLKGHGLGIEIDREKLEAATLYMEVLEP